MKKYFLTFLSLIAAISFSTAQFTAGRVVVLRVGDVSSTLTNASTPVFLDEYKIDGSMGTSVSLPIAGTPITNSGTAASEGQINRSSNAKFVTHSGYQATSGTAAIVSTTSATTSRIIYPVLANGLLGTPASSNTAYSANNIRSSVSDGVNYWAAGNGSAGQNGIQLFDGTPNTQISSTTGNTRVVAIYNGNLYYSTGSGTVGIYKVGTGLPTTTGQVSTNIATGTGLSPYAFSISPDGKVLYVTDDRALISAGGIHKYIDAGSGFVISDTIPVSSGSSTVGAIGLTVDWTNYNGTTFNGAVIYATTKEKTIAPIEACRLVSITDIGISSVYTTLATATTNTVFRGVSFSPINTPTNQPTSLALTTPSSQNVTVNFTASSAAANELLPTGYLLVASTGTITDPVDGTYQADGALVKNIAHTSGSLSYAFTGLTNCTLYNFKVFPYIKDPFSNMIYYNIGGAVLSSSTTTVPGLTISATPLTFGNITTSTTSSEQSYTLQGGNLCQDVTITAPTGFEVSKTTGSGFASSITYTAVEANAGQTVYVHFVPTSAISYSGNITHVSSGATSVDLAVSGAGVAPGSPALVITPTSLTFEDVPVGSNSIVQSYTISGTNLTAGVTIVPPTGYEISKTNFTASNPVTFTIAELAFNQTVYVRFSPATTGLNSANITHTSSGSNNPNLAVTGTGTPVTSILQENATNSLVNLFPNPATDKLFLTINTNTGDYKTIEITNIYGQKIYSKNCSDNMEVDLVGVSKGIYYLTLKGDGGLYSIKFIKE